MTHPISQLECCKRNKRVMGSVPGVETTTLYKHIPVSITEESQAKDNISVAYIRVQVSYIPQSLVQKLRVW